MYAIRIGGTSEFVSAIDPTDNRCCPPGSVNLVVGWKHPHKLTFENRPDAEEAAVIVERIEGYPCEVECI